MLTLYFSGTGNTRHCAKLLSSLIDEKAKVLPLWDESAKDEIKKNDFIILAHPVQFSNIPYYVKRYLIDNKELFKGKKVFCVATMGLFSGDGAGCSARLLKKAGAKVVGGLHIKMPDSVCDSKLLKKPFEKNCEIEKEADAKIAIVAENIKRGKYPKNGLFLFNRIAGLVSQRLWCYKKTSSYTDKLKISDACIGCGKCVSLCPLKNLTLENGKAHASGKCTMCYACISHCPKKAITLLGDKVIEQTTYEKFAEKADYLK